MRGATRDKEIDTHERYYFNPRSSCEERRTHPRCRSLCSYFNPRSSCEERPYLAHDGHGSFLISIHAPHARSDLAAQLSTRKYLLFQSTLLMRGATAIIRPRDACNKISIHAPHARSDKVYVYNPKEKQYISIHAPHARSDALYERVLGYLLISIHAPHARSDTTV